MCRHGLSLVRLHFTPAIVSIIGWLRTCCARRSCAAVMRSSAAVAGILSVLQAVSMMQYSREAPSANEAEPEAWELSAADYEYRGYRIIIRPHDSGWRSTIYAPSSDQPILGPQSDDLRGMMRCWSRQSALSMYCWIRSHHLSYARRSPVAARIIDVSSADSGLPRSSPTT
jgi:hypothetical protein